VFGWKEQLMGEGGGQEGCPDLHKDYGPQKLTNRIAKRNPIAISKKKQRRRKERGRGLQRCHLSVAGGWSSSAISRDEAKWGGSEDPDALSGQNSTLLPSR